MKQPATNLHSETRAAKLAGRAMATCLIASITSAIGTFAAFIPSASATNVAPVVALPDQPFVLPLQRKPNDSDRDVTTQLNNNQRLGAYLAETMLSPGNVHDGSFGLLHAAQVSGQVLAQPLYVHDFYVKGKGKVDLVIVATAANYIYGLDASDLHSVFYRNLSDAKALDPVAGNTLVPVCGETYPPYIGVTSTPVIDSAGFIYVESYNPNTAIHELHKLNLHDPYNDSYHQTVQIYPPPNLPGVDYKNWPMQHRNRPGLLLMGGVVYLAYASFICDNPQPYSGWVFGYTAEDLTQVAYWRSPDLNPDTHPPYLGSSGVWQAGRGLVGSPDDTALYFMTGNDNHFTELVDHTDESGNFQDSRLANSFVKLNTFFSINQAGPTNLTEVTAYSVKNTSQLSGGDTDLGASGPILLPGGRLVGGGKEGRVYVLDSTSMTSKQNDPRDGREGFQAFVNRFHDDVSKPACFFFNPPDKPAFSLSLSDEYCSKIGTTYRIDNFLTNSNYLCAAVSSDPHCSMCVYNLPSLDCYIPHSCYQYCQPYGPNIHAGFVYWQPEPNWGYLYAMPEKESVKAFKYYVNEGRVEETPSLTSNFPVQCPFLKPAVGCDVNLRPDDAVKPFVPDGMPGGALSVSANGTTDGIVWASMPNRSDATNGAHRGSLVALAARDLKLLWRFDCVFYFAKFNPPTIADSKVFLATFANNARAPGQGLPDCTSTTDLLPADNDSNLSPGIAWILEFGLK